MPVLSVTWSLRNHSNMLICSKNISYYYQCWKHLLTNPLRVPSTSEGKTCEFWPRVAERIKCINVLRWQWMCVCVCVWEAQGGGVGMGIFDPKHHLAFMVLRRLRGPLNLMFRWREREAREGKPTPCPNLGGTCVTGGVGWGCHCRMAASQNESRSMTMT